MQYLFFPGCNVKSRYSKSSQLLADYLYKRYLIAPEGCCKENYTKIDKDTNVILICNNCAAELCKRIELNNVSFIYEIIDEDKDFIFPDYQGMTLYLQECHHGYYNKDIETTIHSLLKKMNINYISLPEVVPEGLINKDHRAIVTQQSNHFNEYDYVTYCPICNLTLIKNNKHSHYLLNLLFNIIE
ncbi:MAG: hypothetical protein HUJ56_07600 [Erysipelotrichaceae bacterium]|nr:hypothetical protein [Erysipelotrichaceae bacterium]